MSLKKFLVIMTVVTLVCWIGWITVVFYIDPDSGGFLGLSLFYLSLFLAITGTFALLGFFFRVWFSHNEKVFEHVGIAFRQSILFSILIVGALVLQGVRILTWWNVILFIFAVGLLELFFLTRNPSSR
ncbi:MAG: hypothetical protein Q8Q20_04130 [bacterium]|nr:hypothetical protein [bacterium]